MLTTQNRQAFVPGDFLICYNQRTMIFNVYIVKCADDTLYTGYTKNISRRIQQHNHSKEGARYTKTRRPVTLIYSETFETLKEALRREYMIKKLSRKEKLDLIKKVL